VVGVQARTERAHRMMFAPEWSCAQNGTYALVLLEPQMPVLCSVRPPADAWFCAARRGAGLDDALVTVTAVKLVALEEVPSSSLEAGTVTSGVSRTTRHQRADPTPEANDARHQPQTRFVCQES
jgi:hypothetical protein